jgi:hypothetical protein
MASITAGQIATANGAIDISIALLDLDGELQVRTAEDVDAFDARVAALCDTYRNDPKSIPPLTVAKRAGRYVLIDGHARLQAAMILGCKTVFVMVDQGLENASDVACIEQAWALNIAHGFPPTEADRREMVAWRMKTFPNESRATLLRICGVSETTVQRVRNAVRANGDAKPREKTSLELAANALGNIERKDILGCVKPRDLASVLGVDEDEKLGWSAWLRKTATILNATADELTRKK